MESEPARETAIIGHSERKSLAILLAQGGLLKDVLKMFPLLTIYADPDLHQALLLPRQRWQQQTRKDIETID